MKPLEQARELEKRIRRALFEMGGVAGAREFDEGEVIFRLESIVGVLIMALNDTEMLIKEWSKLPDVAVPDHSDIIESLEEDVCHGTATCGPQPLEG